MPQALWAHSVPFGQVLFMLGHNSPWPMSQNSLWLAPLPSKNIKKCYDDGTNTYYLSPHIKQLLQQRTTKTTVRNEKWGFRSEEFAEIKPFVSLLSNNKYNATQPNQHSTLLFKLLMGCLCFLQILQLVWWKNWLPGGNVGQSTDIMHWIKH